MKPAGSLAIMNSRISDEGEVDFFPTPPWAARAGAELVKRLDPRAVSVWEPACGGGHLAHGLKDYFPVVFQSDAYSYGANRIYDFLSDDPAPFDPDWIMSNSPFGRGRPEAFIRKAYERARRGVAMFLRATMICGQERSDLFDELGLSIFAPFAERCALVEGRWDPDASTATDYAWFIFRKGWRGGERVIRIKPGTEARLTRPSDAAFAVGSADREAA